MNKRRWQYVGGGLVLLIIVAQLFPVAPADNPPVETEVVVPPQVMTVLRQSCYDCHSNETTWPWYSYVIPSKWLVRDHVSEGRRHLNFSAWNRYNERRAARKWHEVAEQVEEGKMPIKSYLLIHRDAALTDEARQVLVDYAKSMSAGVEDEGPRGEGPRPDGGR